jgi:hypothetical protein
VCGACAGQRVTTSPRGHPDYMDHGECARGVGTEDLVGSKGVRRLGEVSCGEKKKEEKGWGGLIGMTVPRLTVKGAALNASGYLLYTLQQTATAAAAPTNLACVARGAAPS